MSDAVLELLASARQTLVQTLGVLNDEDVGSDTGAAVRSAVTAVQMGLDSRAGELAGKRAA